MQTTETGVGIVSSRVALLLRSAEIQPFSFDLFGSPPKLPGGWLLEGDFKRAAAALRVAASVTLAATDARWAHCAACYHAAPAQPCLLVLSCRLAVASRPSVASVVPPLERAWGRGAPAGSVASPPPLGDCESAAATGTLRCRVSRVRSACCRLSGGTRTHGAARAPWNVHTIRNTGDPIRTRNLSLLGPD